MKSIFVLFSFFVLTSILFSQKPMFPEPLSPRIANYKIDVTLDDENKVIHANETLAWKNDSNDKINELQFHLYLNGFKNESTTFMKESQGSHRRSNADIENGLSWIDVTKMKIKDGEELTGKIEFIQPDDSNESDQTVISKKFAIIMKLVAIPLAFRRIALTCFFINTNFWKPLSN